MGSINKWSIPWKKHLGELNSFRPWAIMKEVLAHFCRELKVPARSEPAWTVAYKVHKSIMHWKFGSMETREIVGRVYMDYACEMESDQSFYRAYRGSPECFCHSRVYQLLYSNHLQPLFKICLVKFLRIWNKSVRRNEIKS